MKYISDRSKEKNMDTDKPDLISYRIPICFGDVRIIPGLKECRISFPSGPGTSFYLPISNYKLGVDHSFGYMFKKREIKE